MEVLVVLFIIALLLGVVLGPIGFFKALAAGQQAGQLERQLDRVSRDLENMRELCFKLRDDAMMKMPANDRPGDAAADESKEASAAVEDEDVQDTPTRDEPTTLGQLLKLREQQRHQPEQADADAQAAERIAESDTASQETGDADGEELTRNVDVSEAADDEAEVEVADEAERVADGEEVDEPVLAAAVEQPDADDARNTTPRAAEASAPTRRLTIEEVLAGKVFVWIGAIALVLTAAFLLKLGFDENIITIPVRVIGAGVFGLAMWCVGEWARHRVSLIAQVLCGAGVAVLYGTIIAAEHYQLLGTTSSFAFMGLVTTAAVALSLRHGPAVAILGMLGGFMMPPLLMQDMSPTLGMVLYLIAIEVGVLAVTGKRGWFGISLMTLIFSVVWSLGYTLIGDNAHERTLTAMLVLGTAAAYLYHTARIHSDPASTANARRRVLGLSIAASCSAIGVIALLAVDGEYALRDLGMLGLVAVGALVLARIDARQLAMPFIAMGISFLVLLSNALQSLPGAPSRSLVIMSACFGGLFMFGGYASMWGSKHRRIFALLCAIAGPSFYGIVVFAGHEAFDIRGDWWPYTLGLAGLYALATLPMLLKRKAEYDWPIALFSVLSFALVCITLGQALDHPWFAVCLAGVSAAAALIDLRLFIRPLRVAGCVVAFVAAGLLVVPGPFELTIHGGPIFNTLLPMYALPALCFGIIAWCAARSGSSDTARNLTWLSIATLVGMLFVLTRDIFQPADFLAQAFDLYEWSTYASVLLLACFASHLLGNRLKFEPILSATRCVVGIGAILALIGGLIPGNPLFNRDVVGGLSLSASLLALYVLPAGLIWVWSRQRFVAELPALADALRVVSVALVTFFVGLQIRNAFQLDDLHALHVGMFECATYGLAWVALGALFYWISPRCTLTRVTRLSGKAVFGIGLMTLLVGNAVILNPLWFREAVGTPPVFNGLWYLFGPTILILTLLARKARHRQLKPQARLAGYLAIALSFMLLSTFVRHGFSANGFAVITSNLASSERYAYSLAWVLFGAALLIAGVFTRLDTLRYASLAILLLAVGKVFLIDTANLDNLYRVFSFFGLGVTLIALGYLYQRLVFKRTPNPTRQP